MQVLKVINDVTIQGCSGEIFRHVFSLHNGETIDPKHKSSTLNITKLVLNRGKISGFFGKTIAGSGKTFLPLYPLSYCGTKCSTRVLKVINCGQISGCFGKIHRLVFSLHNGEIIDPIHKSSTRVVNITKLAKL